MTRESAHEWPVVASEPEYETGWYTGGYDRVEQPDGTEKSYYWAELPDAVVVVARTDDELVVVDQYRPAIREFLSVRTVPTEDALDVARREPANDATIEGILLARAEGLL